MLNNRVDQTVFLLGETARTAIVCSPGKLQSIVEGFARYSAYNGSEEFEVARIF